jgi:hypothetical protein
MLLGGWLLAVNLGWSLPYSICKALPAIFIVAGVVGLSFPNRHISRARGAWLIGVGLYLACGFFAVFGLSWGTAWPILMVGGGLALMLRDDMHGCDRGRRRDRTLLG